MSPCIITGGAGRLGRSDASALLSAGHAFNAKDVQDPQAESAGALA